MGERAMSGSSNGGTTHPSARSGENGTAQVPLVIRWVWPVARTSPLVDGSVIGRDASVSVTLPGHEVSRQHAAVHGTGAIPKLRDLDSRNGTWWNGKQITEHAVGPGDVIRIGEWIGVVVEAPGEGTSLDLQDLGAAWYGSATLARAIEPARRVATTDLPVTVQGETGSGKEGMARAIHAWSGRRGEFVAVNCAAIPVAMAEGELFGYRRKAFTDAEREHQGLVRAARGGTLFLDEIVDLHPDLQAKLLRVIEQREVLPLGETKPVPVDTRFVCATQKPLREVAAAGRFREDLLARLDGLTVALPPVRSRREDIVPLFLRLLRDMTGGALPQLDSKFAEAISLYDWPLNVRELAQLARQLLSLHAQAPILKRSMLPERLQRVRDVSSPPPASSQPARSSAADAVSFEHLVVALRAHDGNITNAAQALGITRARANRVLQAHPEFNVELLRRGSKS
jgi:transcriptional regulator of acetoin/glycerol metabolism